jgi:hypothetical protein
MSLKSEMDKNQTVKDAVTRGASIVLITISITITVIPYLLYLLKDRILILTDQTQLIIITISIVITLILALILYFIGTTKIFRNYLMRNNLIELDELTKQLRLSSEKITNYANPKENIVTESYVIFDISLFFKKLIKVRESVKDNNAIRLMSFASNPIEEKFKDKDNVLTYFSNELSFCKEKPDTAVYKIVSIHNKDKLIACKKLLREADKMDIKNFHVAYLNLRKFDNYLPEVIGVDIIGDVVFFMNPEYARITSRANWVSLYIKSEKIADIFREYHTALWEEIEGNEERGVILYDGEKGGIIPHIDEY